MEHSFGTTIDFATEKFEKSTEKFAFHNIYWFVNKQYWQILCQLLKIVFINGVE